MKSLKTLFDEYQSSNESAQPRLVSESDDDSIASDLEQVNTDSAAEYTSTDQLEYKKNKLMAQSDEILAEPSLIKKIITEAAQIADPRSGLFHYSTLLIAEILNAALYSSNWSQVKFILEKLYATRILALAIKNVDLNLAILPRDETLLDFIQAMMLLGNMAFDELTCRYLTKEYVQVLDRIYPGLINKDQKLREFLQKHEELQQRRIMALIWGMAGTTRINGYDFVLDIGYIRSNLLMLNEYLFKVACDKKYATEIAADLEKDPSEDSIDFVNEIIKSGVEGIRNTKGVQFDMFSNAKNIKANDVAYLTRYYRAGRIHHALAFAWWGNYFCYANRGFGDKSSGIHIYELKDNSLSKFLMFNEKESLTVNELEKFLDQNFIPVFHHEMSTQKVGNCSWVATKSLWWFALFLNSLKLISEYKLPLNNPQLFASKIARAGYKVFSSQTRLLSLRQYRELKTTVPKDQALLLKVLEKSKKHSLHERRGFAKITPGFEQKSTHRNQNPYASVNNPSTKRRRKDR